MNRPHSSHYPSAMMRRTARKLRWKEMQIGKRIDDIRRKLEKGLPSGDRATALWMESLEKLIRKAEKCCLELEPLRQELLDAATSENRLIKEKKGDKIWKRRG